LSCFSSYDEHNSDLSACSVVTAWTNGCSWQQAMELSGGLSPGDLVRLFSRVLDALRQFSNLPYTPVRRNDYDDSDHQHPKDDPLSNFTTTDNHNDSNNRIRRDTENHEVDHQDNNNDDSPPLLLLRNDGNRCSTTANDNNNNAIIVESRGIHPDLIELCQLAAQAMNRYPVKDNFLF
jgi:DSHCT (NUC185) domain